LGGAIYDAQCDLIPDFFGNLVENPLKPAIDNLRTAGIPTLAASGNNFGSNVIASPACITSAISVSSTDDNNVSPQYANEADFLDLFAPGGNVTDSEVNSSVPGNTFGLKHGTSMAAPHVTGAWALLKEAHPSASLDDILSALKNTGIAIQLLDFPGTKSLIQIDLALDELDDPPQLFCDRPLTDFNVVNGTSGDDILFGTDGDDLIQGLEGNDSLLGFAGDDCLFGGDGIDKLSGGDDNDELHGGNGDDDLTGRGGIDKLFGDAGEDTLSGGAGNDSILDGGADDDVILGRDGDDTMIGGDGFDLCIGGTGTDSDTTCEYVADT